MAKNNLSPCVREDGAPLPAAKLKGNPLMEIENEVLDEGREWIRLRLEERLQEEAVALSACPQSGLTLKKNAR